jgi:1-acyl-sn-glycerol-3-phosphate acyltransferase
LRWAAWLFARVVLNSTLPWLAGFRVAGRRRIPREGGVLVVANHVGDLDPLFVGIGCVPRQAQYMADARHYRHLPFARLLFAVGAFPVRPGSPDTRALRHAREQLLAGELIVVFAEGRPGWGAPMGEFLKGAGHLGLTPGVTVVPAAVWGVQHLMRGWRPVGRGPVLVAFGHPVPVPEDGSRRERAAELTRRTRHAVGELLEPMMRAHP